MQIFKKVVNHSCYTTLVATVLLAIGGWTATAGDLEQNSTYGQVTEKDVHAMLALMGIEPASILERALHDWRATMPDVPSEVWNAFRESVRSESIEQMLYLAYTKHFTSDEMREIARFLSSPIGMKMLQSRNQLEIDLMAVRNDWTKGLHTRLIEHLEKQGYTQDGIPKQVAMMKACQKNLRSIDAAKEQVALAKRIAVGGTIAQEDLLPYLKRGKDNFSCPSGGTYVVGKIGERPKCTVHGTIE